MLPLPTSSIKRQRETLTAAAIHHSYSHLLPTTLDTPHSLQSSTRPSIRTCRFHLSSTIIILLLIRPAPLHFTHHFHSPICIIHGNCVGFQVRDRVSDCSSRQLLRVRQTQQRRCPWRTLLQKAIHPLHRQVPPSASSRCGALPDFLPRQVPLQGPEVAGSGERLPLKPQQHRPDHGAPHIPRPRSSVQGMAPPGRQHQPPGGGQAPQPGRHGSRPRRDALRPRRAEGQLEPTLQRHLGSGHSLRSLSLRRSRRPTRPEHRLHILPPQRRGFDSHGRNQLPPTSPARRGAAHGSQILPEPGEGDSKHPPRGSPTQRGSNPVPERENLPAPRPGQGLPSPAPPRGSSQVPIQARTLSYGGHSRHQPARDPGPGNPNPKRLDSHHRQGPGAGVPAAPERGCAGVPGSDEGVPRLQQGARCHQPGFGIHGRSCQPRLGSRVGAADGAGLLCRRAQRAGRIRTQLHQLLPARNGVRDVPELRGILLGHGQQHSAISAPAHPHARGRRAAAPEDRLPAGQARPEPHRPRGREACRNSVLEGARFPAPARFRNLCNVPSPPILIQTPISLMCGFGPVPPDCMLLEGAK